MFKEGDKVRRTSSRNAVDIDFEGPTRQHGKKVGTVIRVYEDLGEDVCDLEYADGTTEGNVPLGELEPAKVNVED